jgi:hypothetical protein
VATVSITSHKMHEIEAETRFFKLDRLLALFFSVAFAVLAMVSLVSAIAPTFAGISQALLRVAAFPH